MRELWDDLHYPGRRQALHRALCRLGLHYPIVWSLNARMGSYDPPEPPEEGWLCDTCGEIRLPYRARLWSVPLIGRWVR